MSAVIASTTTAARYTWQRSCRPPMVRVCSDPSSCRHSTGWGSETTGWNATRNSTGMPLLMPPCTPPQWFVRVEPSGFQRSMYSLPVICAVENPAPISKPIADGMESMANARWALSLPKMGSPKPMGSPVTVHCTVPP